MNRDQLSIDSDGCLGARCSDPSFELGKLVAAFTEARLDFPVIFATPTAIWTYAISRVATCASAFVRDDFRCSELTLTPSAAMTSGLAMPMKASTLFR
ncbi:hypothetical protein SAMN02927900_00950 [Rhizobium mongolense subsp. loessense]|uniref:Uncharacterized protein n=1 Tax=Rhizobium mongolense subsp. loessense TaxID=158890 RepID=A0A1G4PTG8_9HYPH|nr:hypothetical protein SAMN02927900_00950 [Rhizobium mongolense subsp. loessense]